MRGLKLKRYVLLILIFGNFMVLIPEVLAAKQNIKIGDKVPNFVLENTDGKQYELDKMRGKIIILVLGPKKTEENNIKWVKMLLHSFPKSDSLKIFTVVDMRGIPIFITDDFVRGKVKEKQHKHPVTILMDWKQKVNNMLGADKNETNIFIIDANGILVSHQVGTYSEEKLRLLRDKIIDIIESDNSKEKKG